MGRLKDWLMQRYGAIDDPEEGPTDDAYYRTAGEPELQGPEPYPVRAPVAGLMHRLNHEPVNEEEF